MRLIYTYCLLFPLIAFAQFDPAGGEVGSYSVDRMDPAIIAWADNATIKRGWLNVADTTLGKVSAGADSNAQGPADNSIVSLGDGGEAVLYFEEAIRDLKGADIAVFENAFYAGGGYFLELAFVEVSVDGVNYTRFPAYTDADSSLQYNNDSRMRPEWYKNLAGKHQAPYGTLFDLEELGLDSIHFVRVVDVVGTLDSALGSRDAEGRIINDPYPTDFVSGGFDLDAVAAVKGQFISVAETLLSDKVFPTLLQQGEQFHIELTAGESWLLKDMQGRLIDSGKANNARINVKGQFVLELRSQNTRSIIKLCVY